MTDFENHTQFGPLMGNNKRRFEVKYKLGEGAQGTCYLAIDHEIAGGLPVCVKFFVGQTIDRKDVTPNVRHDGIANVIHSGVVEMSDVPVSYVVYEYIDGKPLGEWVNDTPLSLREVCDLAIEIIDVVQVCHNHGVFHRDLKPSNIIMLSGKPVLVDFGIASKDGGKSLSGSPMFMAPEQTSLQETPALVDQYGVGGVIYWLLTGKAPNGKSDEIAIENLEARKIADYSSIPRPIRSVTKRALELTAGSRYPSMGDLRHDLESVRRGEAPSTMRQTRWNRTKIFLRKNPIKIAAVFVLIGSLAGYQVHTLRELKESNRKNNMLRSAMEITSQGMAEMIRYSVLSDTKDSHDPMLMHGISAFANYGGFEADELTHLLSRDGVLEAFTEANRIEQQGEAGPMNTGLVFLAVAHAQAAYTDDEQALEATFDRCLWHLQQVLPTYDPDIEAIRERREWCIQLVRSRQIAEPRTIEIIESYDKSIRERQAQRAESSG